MTRKITGKGDLLILRKATTRGIWVEPYEQRKVLTLVGDTAFALYYLFRSFPFRESTEISDENIANLMGWNQRKTQKYRLVLEQADLLRVVRYGTKSDGVTKLFVGADTVALFNAGLPADILQPKHLDKIKRKLGIKTAQDLSAHYQDVVDEYENNLGEYE